jgi:hypothetical protein
MEKNILVAMAKRKEKQAVVHKTTEKFSTMNATTN